MLDRNPGHRLLSGKTSTNTNFDVDYLIAYEASVTATALPTGSSEKFFFFNFHTFMVIKYTNTYRLVKK